MPPNHGFRLDDGERRAPATPEARQTDPQQAVSRGQFQAFCSSSPKHNDLVTQSQVLELEGGTRSEDRRQSREECHKSSEHRRNYERCNSHPFRSFEVFERHSLCVAQSTSTSKCRESVSRNNPVLDQQEFGRPDQREAAFPLQEGKRRCNWLAPAKRPVAGIGGVIRRPEESLPRALVPAVPLPWAPGRLCPSLNAYATADSRQNNCAEFDATISRSTR